MLIAIFILLGYELFGELLRGALHLPIPGPVIGMAVLTIGLALGQRKEAQTETPALTPLDRAAATLLEYMGLLFVPAGVGIVDEIGLLRQEWLPILGGAIGSTVLSLGLTGIIMHHMIPAKQSGQVQAPAKLASSSRHAEATS
jgi:holin-like protein